MKKLILLLTTLLMFAACYPIENSGVPREPVKNPNATYEGYSTLILDGCEYWEIGLDNSYSYAFTHKGNCKNPIHNK